ncbi:MAG: hypothetical protein WA156_12290, partial [Methylocystis silviterrae]
MQNAAFRCGLALAFLALHFVCLAEAQEGHGEQQCITNGAECQKPFPNFPAAWSPRPVQPKTVEKDETDWRYPNCSYPNSLDEADLCEQRKMSASADQTIYLGWWQLALSVFGFAALIYTLYLTRIATGEAVESNKIARGTAESELRAYVFAEQAILKRDGNVFKATVTIKNSGQTPAYKFDHFSIIEGTDNPRVCPFIGGSIDIKR